jgi:hypothetical protein
MVRTITILITRNSLATVVCVILAGLALQSNAVQAADDVGNPHWSSDGCYVCHGEAAPVKGSINLRADDAEALCESCHGSRGDALPCRHSSDIPAGGLTIAESLQSSLKDGKVVCTTCHDIVHQCERPKHYYSLQNRGFLRDRTSHEAGAYCYKCHEDSKYSALNPHADRAGSQAACLLCHPGVPEESVTGDQVVMLNMKHDLNEMCLGCHDTRPHPRKIITYSAQEEDAWVHLVAPSQKVIARLRQAEQANGIVLPLSPTNGEVICATCHDPHEFKDDSVTERPEYRLRVHDICQTCHG